MRIAFAILTAVSGCLVGVVIGVTLRRKGAGAGGVTRLLFLTSQVAALCWVSISYIIALYGTVKYGTAYPVVTLSQQAITTILGVGALKVIENIFEHNDGGLFGKSKSEDDKGPADGQG